MHRTERTVETPYADIRLTETDGTGIPIVLLHGSGADRRVFEPQLASWLAERHHIIAIDLPGHGESSDARDPATGYTLPGFAHCVSRVLESLAVGRCVVFGWSLGGHIAVELMHEYPKLVAGVMLSGAPPIANGPIGMLRGFHASWDMLLASKEKFTPRDIERYARLCYGEHVTPDLLDAVRRTDGRARAVFSRSLMRGDGADQRRTVETASVPVALVDGERDPLVRLNYTATVSSPYLWEGGAHLVKDAGHAAFRDSPERFNTLLQRFASDMERWKAPAKAASVTAAIRA
ncbi:MAG TPA: alpha/beta hydrolase [Devosia sp.]|nr:alpha/beta hydrolase [Devosia sp.]